MILLKYIHTDNYCYIQEIEEFVLYKVYIFYTPTMSYIQNLIFDKNGEYKTDDKSIMAVFKTNDTYNDILKNNIPILIYDSIPIIDYIKNKRKIMLRLKKINKIYN